MGYQFTRVINPRRGARWVYQRGGVNDPSEDRGGGMGVPSLNGSTADSGTTCSGNIQVLARKKGFRFQLFSKIVCMKNR